MPLQHWLPDFLFSILFNYFNTNVHFRSVIFCMGPLQSPSQQPCDTVC
uniref:Uncharacterized protein n=1 Tax=Anguilla anguilla TaxID=7936 RepID=A0A0E9SQD7_ANGAN